MSATPGDETAPGARVRGAWARAAAVGVVLASLAFLSTGRGRQLFDVAMQTIFQRRVTMQVAPGNVRVKAGSPLGINARLVGGRVQAGAQVEIGDGAHWRTIDMATDDDGRFRLRLDSIDNSFKYRVLAGSVTSPTYTVAVGYPPAITNIAVDYAYPDQTGLKPRHDEHVRTIDGLAGTKLRLFVYVDRPAAIGVLAFSNGERMALTPVAPTELSTSLTLESDATFRVLLAGADGIRNDGDTEYVIRVAAPDGRRASAAR